jgi:hypothetical protein
MRNLIIALTTFLGATIFMSQSGFGAAEGCKIDSGMLDQIEGTYEVTLGAYPGHMTLASRGDGTAVIGMLLNVGEQRDIPMDFGFFKVCYNVDEHAIEALRYTDRDNATGVGTGYNYYAKLTFSQSQVAGKASVNRDGLLDLAGHHTVDLPKPPTGGTRSSKITGVYAGQTNDHEPVEVLITKVSSEYSATMFFGASRARADLRHVVFGDDANSRTIYLTSGETQRGQWIQLRGHLDGDSLSVDWIDGGEGMRYQNIVLTRKQPL